eukprot:20658-Heterococcus_DN1.PRE.1
MQHSLCVAGGKASVKACAALECALPLAPERDELLRLPDSCISRPERLRAGAIDFGTANPGTRPKCIPKFGLTELLLTQTHLDLPLLVLTQTHIRMALLHSILIHTHTHSHTTLSLSNGLCATANMGIPQCAGFYSKVAPRLVAPAGAICCASSSRNR